MVHNLTIEDLARMSGLPLRTLRYYIQEGLLPGPDTAGKYASYSQEHLDHLAMIDRLKRLRLPLKEIRHLLSAMSLEDMRRMLNYQDQVQFSINDASDPDIYENNQTSALEYIRDLERRQSGFRSLTGSPSIPAAPQSHHNQQENYQPIKNRNLNATGKESWTRFVIDEGIELNIREGIARKHSREVNELIDFAANLFSEKN
jgi:DNA-binding transcriptional MerR regulator